MELKFNEGMRLDVLRESSNRTFMELKLLSVVISPYFVSSNRTFMELKYRTSSF